MDTIKNLLGYIGCICITIAVAYFIDGTAGIILTAALICAFIISLALTLIVRRFICVDIKLSRDLLSKGDVFTLKVNLRKNILLPSPPIIIEAGCTPQVKFTSDKIYSGSVAGNETNTIEIPLEAVHSGAGKIYCIRVQLSDFLGIFSFKLKDHTEDEKLAAKVAVYPNIPDTDVQADLIKTVSQFGSDNDEEDEETDETALGSTGTPGYEHRRYYPGDPIKKINWKLSSKRDIYMIRLDEKVASAGRLFFLDCPPAEENDYVLTVRDTVIEGALAMMTMLVKDGREAGFFRFDSGMWLRTDIRNMADVYTLQEAFSNFEPHQPPQPLPADIVSSGKVPICFTAAFSENSTSVADIVSKSPDAMIISAECASLNDISPNMWIITDEFELRQKKS